MNRQQPILCALLTLLAAASTAEPGSPANTPDMYLNKNLGFNIEGYNYSQSEYPCDVDQVLVEKVVKRAEKQGLAIEATGAADKILEGNKPVLAIDVESLALGSKDFTFGTKNSGDLPSMRVTAAVVKRGDDAATAEHSCAITSLRRLNPSADILDAGVEGQTMCSAMHKCLDDLSADIVEWVVPQMGDN